MAQVSGMAADAVFKRFSASQATTYLLTFLTTLAGIAGWPDSWGAGQLIAFAVPAVIAFLCLLIAGSYAAGTMATRDWSTFTGTDIELLTAVTRYTQLRQNGANMVFFSAAMLVVATDPQSWARYPAMICAIVALVIGYRQLGNADKIVANEHLFKLTSLWFAPAFATIVLVIALGVYVAVALLQPHLLWHGVTLVLAALIVCVGIVIHKARLIGGS